MQMVQRPRLSKYPGSQVLEGKKADPNRTATEEFSCPVSDADRLVCGPARLERIMLKKAFFTRAKRDWSGIIRSSLGPAGAGKPRRPVTLTLILG